MTEADIVGLRAARNILQNNRHMNNFRLNCFFLACQQIRSQVAEEWIQELKQIAEENAVLLRESVATSFNLDNVVEKPVATDYGKQD